MQQLTVRITGMSPLLMHSTAGMAAEPKKGLRTKNDNLTGREEAEVGAYRDGDDGLVFPTIAFSRALWDAASGVKIGKATARTLLAGLVQTSEFVPVVNPKTGKQLSDFDVDTRFVRVGTARVPRSRAKIAEWGINLSVDYDENLLHPEAIVALFEKAGQLIGIGDYRPKTGGGPFGRFSVKVA